DRDNGLTFWSLEQGQLVRTFKSQLGNFIAVTPDGTQALSHELYDKLKLWDVASGQVLHTFEGHSNRIASVAASPDRTRLLTVDNKVKLWDAARGRLERTIDDRGAQSVVFSPDGAQLLAGNYSSVTLWDVINGRIVRDLKTPTPSANQVAF